MRERSASVVSFGQSLQQWRYEQFRAINRVAFIGVTIGFVAYTVAYVALRQGHLLAIAALLAALGVLLQVSTLLARSNAPERGTLFFCYSIIGSLVIAFYIQRGALIGFSIMTLMTPIVIGIYLLESRHARYVAVAGILAIIHNLTLSSLKIFPTAEVPLAVALVMNLIVAPLPLAVLVVLNFRASSRVNQAISRLEGQSTALEETVRRRTAQLTTAAEIGRAASASFDLSELLSRTVHLIRDRFGYYHASVFLLDPSGENAIVAESTGEVGRIMKERRHTLAVGSQSIVGYVTAQRKPRVALDVSQDVVHFKNPLLAETRSELAIPLIAGDRLVGALDVQSRDPDAFTAADVSVLQTVADQLAIAINNAQLFGQQRQLIEDNERLLAESRHAIEELNVLAGRLSREGWHEFTLAQHGLLSATSENGEAAHGLGPESALSLAVQERDQVSTSENDRSALAVPIMLRDQIIGAIAIEETGLTHHWSADDLALTQEVADRLGLALDNARLLEQVNRERERLGFLFEASRALAASLKAEDVLTTALGFAPRIGAQHGFILLTEAAGLPQFSFRSTLPGFETLTDERAHAIHLALSGRGLARWVIDNPQATVVYDSAKDPRWVTGPSTDMPARSVLAAPLRTPLGAVAGLVAYTHAEPGAFTEDQIPFIESIGAQLSVALNNAHLYSQVERQQRSAASLAISTQTMARSLSEAELFQSLVDQLVDIYRPNGVVIYRRDPDSVTLTPIAIHVDPYDRDPWPRTDTPFSAGDRLDLLEVMHRRTGRVVKLRDEPNGEVRESMTLPFICNDKVEGVVEVVRTGPAVSPGPEDMRLFQAVLISAAFTLQTARLYQRSLETAERLREIDRLKSQFLANMSHELRTPLNSIIGFSRVILKGIDGPINDTQQQDLTAIHSAGQHLLGLINDILDLSRIEAGKMDLNFDKVDLAELIKGVMSTTIGLVKDKPIKLFSEVDPELAPVRADSIRLRQILLNLMSNAAKFTDQGSITIRAHVLQVEGQRPMMEVGVQDTGPGIPEQDLGKLFQTFSQVDGSATRKVGGSGLGLSISKNLVELQGGKIWVESQVGAGSIFSFNIPLYIEEGPAPNVEGVLPGAFPEFKIRSVLAIDDDARLIDIYRRFLEPKGFTLHGLVNPREAVAAARALKPQYILLDVVMPEYDGWRVLADLKGHAETRDIPIIVCSIVAEQDKARSLGAADYLLKPVLDMDLVGALNRINGSNGHGSGPRKN